MRILEILLSALLITVAAGLLVKPKWLAERRLWVFSVLSLLLGWQAVLEGTRWQLYFLYAAFILLVVLLLGGIKKGRAFGAIVVLVLGVVGVLLASLLPVVRPFPTTGPYQVGTISYHAVDPDRTEIYAEVEGLPREVMVQVWYPAEPGAEGPNAPWMHGMKQAAPYIADYLDLPFFMLDHLALIEANSLTGVPLADNDGLYPVLVFSHGWAGFKEQNIYQVEELASHGYVVIGVNHTYGAIHTLFPDGREAPRNPDALPRGVSDEEYGLASKILVRQWAGDIGFVLDELAAGVQETAAAFLNGHLELSRVGVLGHSTGGGAGVEFCAVDPRCVVFLGMDAWLEPVTESYLEERNHFPVLLMHSEGWSTDGRHLDNFVLVDRFTAANTEPVMQIMIEGITHMDFTILPIITPLAEQLGFKGPLEGERTLMIINVYTVAFFDQYMSGLGSGLDGLNTVYPEAILVGE